mgnify:CR=1 FL=1
MDTELKEYLHKNHIPYKLHEHSPVFTVEQASRVKSIQRIPGMRTKNLFLKDENGRFYLMSMPGHKRLEMKLLAKHLKVKHITFGSPDELKAELNLTPGSVSIFGLIYATHTTLLIDNEVWNAPIIGSHPNINTATIEITHDALCKFLDTLSCSKEVVEIG